MQATTNHILRENAPHRREAAPLNSGKPKLHYQFREASRPRNYSLRTEQTYVQWVKRFIFIHNVRYSAEMTEVEINAFLTHLSAILRRSFDRRRLRYPNAVQELFGHSNVKATMIYTHVLNLGPLGCSQS